MEQKVITNLKRDRLLRRCESLMLRGLDSPTDISRELNIAFGSAKSYISIIQQRWTDSNNTEDLEAKRQELVRKTEEVIREAWELRKNAKNTLEAVAALRTIIMAVERLEKLQGIAMLPIPEEKSQELRVAEMAEEVNKLPKEAREVIIKAVRRALIMVEGEKITKDVRFA